MLGPERILGIDIGASTVKIGEFQTPKGKALRLTNFNHADLGVDPEHEENRRALIVSTIRNVLREKGIRRSKVVFSVSGQSVFTRFVKLPPVDQSKVIQIIQYEAQQNVPFPIEEVVWDYQLIGNGAGGELDVVLMAIKSDIIEELNESVQAAGLRTEMVDVAPMALYNAVRYNYGDPGGCTVVLDIGARTTNLLFLEQNKIFSRSIPIAGNTITQQIASEFNVPFLTAEQMKKTSGFVALGGAYEEPADETQARISKIIRTVMTRLHAEVTRSINFYRSQQNGSAPARVLLSGGSSIIPYTDRFFLEKLQIPIEYFNPFRNVDVDARVSREELQRCAHFFGEVVGLGLRRLTECPIEVNLLPQTIRRRKKMESRQPYLIAASIALLLIPLCWWLYTSQTARLMDLQLQEYQKQVERYEKLETMVQRESKQITDLRQRANEISSLVRQRSSWPSLLQDLNSRVVSNLWIISLTPQTTASEGTASAPPPTSRPTPHLMHGRGLMPATEAEEVAPPTGASSGQTTIRWLTIEGRGSHNFNNSAMDLRMVNQFAQNLRESRFFDKTGVEIAAPPDLMTDKPTFSFTLKAKLAHPIPQ